MNQPQLNKIGATPGKLALVAVLAIVLIVVIVQQLPERNPQLAPTNNSSPITTQQTASTTTNTSTTGDSEEELSPWPATNLTSTLTHNPFAPPSWGAKMTDNTNGLLAQLKAQGASIVMISAQHKSATIGNQQVRVGDIVEGYRITDITDQGVLLNKLDTR